MANTGLIFNFREKERVRFAFASVSAREKSETFDPRARCMNRGMHGH